GLFSMIFVKDQYGLIASMLGVGIAWAAILAMPYAMLSASLPAEKMGVYMGIFNATITIPQITAGLLGGALLSLLGGHAVYMLGLSGACMVAAGISVIFIKEKKYPKEI
ncbi:MAG: MFS transporter, partial [Bacteroidetes bacterium]|nr:MFS transporter [Bacteroidota bacterium]